MAKCQICEKGVRTGHRISITRSQVSRRYNRTWKPNIKKIRIVLENGTVKTVAMCTSCLRTGKVKRAV
ncbi:MAG: 50S ribosomal protein L28 [Defluviitaleaceae bacterium]|nr:50S ribosomal protein L28 [Defluviitaleaceae bacterium]